MLCAHCRYILLSANLPKTMKGRRICSPSNLANFALCYCYGITTLPLGYNRTRGRTRGNGCEYAFVLQVPIGSTKLAVYELWFLTSLTSLSSLSSSNSIILLPLLLRKSPMIPRFSSSFLCKRICFEIMRSENLSSL